jgi:hypothetical protein
MILAGQKFRFEPTASDFNPIAPFQKTIWIKNGIWSIYFNLGSQLSVIICPLLIEICINRPISSNISFRDCYMSI